MILHIYHCSRALIEDRPGAKSKARRPRRLTRYPSKAGQVDIDYSLPLSGFRKEQREIVEAFASIDILNPDPDIISINWDGLAGRLHVSRRQLMRTMRNLYRDNFLRHIGAIPNYPLWTKANSEKGCLAVMTCVELGDHDRPEEVVKGFLKYILAARKDVTKTGGSGMGPVIVIPNAHFTDEATTTVPGREEKDHDILEACCSALQTKGLRTHLCSYGYAKNFLFFIHAHNRGYLYRRF